ncbi:MAG: hypothetical protein ACR2KL_13705, partial [Nocardioidaceae bacterium]
MTSFIPCMAARSQISSSTAMVDSPPSREKRRWIQKRVEQPQDRLPREEQLRILAKLNQAEAFETFLQDKLVGQKRFSLEGAETTIPLVDEICEAAAESALDEVCIGM